MNSLNWEFFESLINNSLFRISDPGPLNYPITSFNIYRNNDLDIILETTSAHNSASNSKQRKPGEVYISTDEVKFHSQFCSTASANGIIPISHTKTFNQESSTTNEISKVHLLKWNLQDNHSKPYYIIEWIGNLSDRFIWPHKDDYKELGTNTRTLRSAQKEIEIIRKHEKSSYSSTCAHIKIDGIDIFFGTTKEKSGYVPEPGFILYEGTPTESIRSKIRDCLAFSLGSFLIHLGETVFNSDWEPIAFTARSGHALVEESKKLNRWQPSPLGLKWEKEIDERILTRMVSSIFNIYDEYNLNHIFWCYWHALAAPTHMAAAHFGAAIESLQNTYLKSNTEKTIIPKDDFTILVRKIHTLIQELDVQNEDKEILKRKIENCNQAPQSILMSRLFNSLELKISKIEKDAWINRNRAAHGSTSDKITDKGSIELIRNNKILLILINRIILKISNGSGHYYDYYTIGHPTRNINDSIQN